MTRNQRKYHRTYKQKIGHLSLKQMRTMMATGVKDARQQFADMERAGEFVRVSVKEYSTERLQGLFQQARNWGASNVRVIGGVCD